MSAKNGYLEGRDTAGDNFVRRLQSKYPEMHRISTVEPYKDWNEQLSKNNSEKILDFSDLKCYNEGEDEEMNVNTVKTAYTDSIEKITSSSEEWEKFLRFSAELRIPEQEQKHNFSSKLLIYSVNPDVKECRTFSEWKNTIHNLRQPNNAQKTAQFFIQNTT